MPAKHTNHMKATVWTPTMRSDVEGTPDGVIPQAFWALDTPKRREACIAELQRIDGIMRGHEAEESRKRADLMAKAGVK
jgi:hypothetical protein